MKTKLLFLLLGLVSLGLTAQVHADFWEDQATGFTEASRAAADISIVTDDVVWVRVYDGANTSNVIQEFTKTTDGGATWTPGTIDVGNPALGISMVHGISATTAWCVAFPPNGTEAGQGIFKTTDGGTTWVKQTSALYSGNGAFVNVVYFWDENKGFCQGDPVDGYYECYTTDDGGANWTRVPSANIPAGLSGEYGYTSQIFVTGDAMWWTTNKGRIYRSYDFGHTFEVFQSPISDFGGAAMSGEVSFSDDNNGYLVNVDNTFWKTADGGENWDITFPDTGLVFGGNVFGISGSDWVFSTGAGDLTGSSYSTDGGLNWVVMCDDQHLDIRFSDTGSVGWSGAFSVSATEGGIFKYIGPGLGIAELEAIGFEAYPNPVQDVLNMSAQNEISNVQIFNMLGQKVLTQEVNALTAKINTANLANGTYIVQITIGDVVGSMKIIK
ncbi:MAG TPA: T9SS type A sorting domain-containing protein [Lutibacter sp.]|nr:T9SS type A sorting domain-containing protein [Lutibacter sp.]